MPLRPANLHKNIVLNPTVGKSILKSCFLLGNLISTPLFFKFFIKTFF